MPYKFHPLSQHQLLIISVLNSALCRHEREQIQPQITWALRTQKHSLEPNQFILVSSRTVEETSSHEINICGDNTHHFILTVRLENIKGFALRSHRIYISDIKR